MSAEALLDAWRPHDLVWRNRHVKVVHFVPHISAVADGTLTACGIYVPAPQSETHRYAAFPTGYTACPTCYPDGRLHDD